MGSYEWPADSEAIDGYIARSKDASIVSTSSAGGAFSAFAETIIDSGGIVFGAAYVNGVVTHVSAETCADLARLRGSKYAQSRIGSVFQDVERNLRNGRQVLFSGTPCQVAGLKSFLSVRTGNKIQDWDLYTTDFVCHGVGSPKALRLYLEELSASGFDVVNMNMRSKHFGYHSGSMELRASDGRVRYIRTRNDDLLGPFYANLILRPSCHACSFKGYRRISDLTIWDSWYAEEILDVARDDLGYTNIITHSAKGEELLLRSSDSLELYKVSFSSIRPNAGGMMVFPSSANPDRDSFLEEMSKSGLRQATRKYLPSGVNEVIRDFIRDILWRVGLLGFVKRRMRKRMRRSRS